MVGTGRLRLLELSFLAFEKQAILPAGALSRYPAPADDTGFGWEKICDRADH
jgi:hypothetical protein